MRAMTTRILSKRDTGTKPDAPPVVLAASDCTRRRRGLAALPPMRQTERITRSCLSEAASDSFARDLFARTYTRRRRA
jgi:hypothetical protein